MAPRNSGLFPAQQRRVESPEYRAFADFTVVFKCLFRPELTSCDSYGSPDASEKMDMLLGEPRRYLTPVFRAFKLNTIIPKTG